jgi:hypothetical protein
MNAYRAYDVIEERKWAEQTLTEEKQKWIDDRAQEIIDALPRSRQACSASLYRWTKAHMKASAAISWRGIQRFISAIAYAQAEYDWDHRTGCPF